MRSILIAAVGKMREGPEQALMREYVKRLSWRVEIKEIEEKRTLTPIQRKASEAEKLLAVVKDASFLVALDAGGKEMSSEKFASSLEGWMGQGSIAFVIGGADGLDKSLLNRANIILSLGKFTWPHMLARVMLAEQLYRAHTILAGHPYHRA